MDVDSDILRANVNQQGGPHPERGYANIRRAIREERGRDFTPAYSENYPASPVIFVGGGSAEEFDSVFGQAGGADQVRVVAVGSAAFRLDKEAQEKAGYPHLETADSVVLNGIDDGTQGDYYDRVAKAVLNYQDRKGQGVSVYLASYNGEAFEALPHAIRVNGLLPGFDYSDHLDVIENQPIVGLGSTAPTAGLIIAMLEGHKEFHFVGCTGAIVQQSDTTRAELLQSFSDATERLSEADRYPDYEMPEELQRIAHDKKVTIAVGENHIAQMPIGQWYQLQELGTLVRWGRQNDMKFTFHGDDSVSRLVLDMGEAVTMLHDPKGNFAPGTKIFGSVKAVDEMPVAVEPRNER